MSSDASSSVLVLALLSVESSYLTNIERPSTGVEDTIQFWLGATGAWRIRTYAIDHDIHVHSLGAMDRELAQTLIAKRYADVLKQQHVFTLSNPADAAEVQRLLQTHGLSGTLEVTPDFAFYNPDDGAYSTQSTPS